MNIHYFSQNSSKELVSDFKGMVIQMVVKFKHTTYHYEQKIVEAN